MHVDIKSVTLSHCFQEYKMTWEKAKDPFVEQ